MALPPQGQNDQNVGDTELFDLESGETVDHNVVDGMNNVVLGGRAEVRAEIDTTMPNVHLGGTDVRDPNEVERLQEQAALGDAGIELKSYEIRIDEQEAQAAAEAQGPVGIAVAFKSDGLGEDAELHIHGLPDGYTTNVGERNADGSVTVRGDDVERLVIVTDDASTGDGETAEELILQIIGTGVEPLPPTEPLGPQFGPEFGPPRDGEFDREDLPPREAPGLENAGAITNDEDEEELVDVDDPVEQLDLSASDPQLRTFDTGGAEDTEIPIDIRAKLSDLDGSESLSVTVGNVPAGAQLSAGTDNGDGTWTLEGPDLQGLTITPPQDYSGSLNLNVEATSMETSTGDTATVTTDLEVTVDAVLDAPDVSVNYGMVTAQGSQGSVPADGMVFRFSAKDIDGGGNAGSDGGQVNGLTDLSGNNHNATTSGSAPNFETDAFGGNGGIQLTAGNDGLTVADASAINTGTYAEKSFAFTFETGGSVDGFQTIYEQGGSARGYSLTIAPDPDTGDAKLFAFAWNNIEWGAGDQYKVIDLGAAEPGTSYSVAMVHDSTNGDGTLSGYVNGEHVETLTNVPAMNPHGGDVGIGRTLEGAVRPDTLMSSGDGHEFQGAIGEVISWNSALSADDVEELTTHFSRDFDTPGGVEQSYTVEMNLNIGADAGDNASVQSVVIDNLPDGVVLSAGTDNGDGSVTLTEAELDGLTITVPNGQAGFPIHVTATLVDPEGNTETTVANVPSPDLYMDGTALSAEDVSGAEDTAIALDIELDLSDTDGSETVSVTIDGVPSGAQLSAGTDNGDGSWTLNDGDLDGLTVTPPANSDADFQLGVTVTTTETSTGETSEATANIDVSVGAVADQTTVSASIGDVVEASEGSVPTNGMVFRYSAKDVNGNGDGSDNPADGTNVGTWSDLSGNGFNAETHGSSPSFDGNGLSGNGGIGFDSGDDGLQIGNQSAINTSTYSEKSFAFAIETGDSVDGFQMIYEQGGTGNGYSLSIAPDADTGEPTLFAFAWGESYFGGGNHYKVIELGTVEPNTSYSAAMVHDANDGDGTFTGYLNGDQVGQLTNVPEMGSHAGEVSLGAMNDNSVNPVTLADTSDVTGSQFQGTIAEAISWNSALSADDVTELTQHMFTDWGTPGGVEPNGVTVELDITAGLSDTDGSEILTITVDGLPDGAVLSAGTDNGDGSWSLEPAELNSLTMTVPNGSGVFALDISATASEGAGGSATTNFSLAVSDLTADGATLDTSAASGTEDAVIPLDIDLTLNDTDGSETVSITIEGVPSGAQLSAGTDNGDGSWTLDGGDMEGLSITPATNSGDDFQLSVTATTTETSTGNTSETTSTVDVSVTGEVDDFSVSVSVGEGTPTSTVVPSNGMVFHLNAKNIDGDGNAANQPGDNSAVSRWEDISGNNHDATANGGNPSFDTDAFGSNGGVQFDSGNDGMTIANSADINTATYAEKSFAFTFETGSSVDGFQVIYEQGGGSRGYSMSIGPDPDTGEAKLFAFAWNNKEWPSGEHYKVIDLGAVEPNTSYSAAMVHDSTDGNGTFKGYMNGELEGTLTNVPAMNGHGGLVGVGKVINASVRPDTLASSGDGHQFEGNIGEIASWNTALSADDVQDFTNHATQDFGTPGGAASGLNFDVDITTSLGDTDGSETVGYMVDGLPDGASLSAGTDNGDGTWSLTSEQADGLSMSVPDSASDFVLSVRADVTEADGDTESAWSHTEVDVSDDGFDAGTQGTSVGDILTGTSSDDQLFGNAGDDQLTGGVGNDFLSGGVGNDTLGGGEGNDTLVGGDGDDIFTFGPGAGNDVVQGGDGWLDTVQLQDIEGGPSDAWSLELDKGSVEEQADGYVALSGDASGTITLEDGSTMDFNGIDKIEW